MASILSFKPGTYEASSFGMDADVNVKAVFDNENLKEVTIDVSGEAEDKGGQIGNEMKEQFIEAQSPFVDGVSGVTYTSLALKNAMEDIFKQAAILGEASSEDYTEEYPEETAIEIEETEVETDSTNGSYVVKNDEGIPLRAEPSEDAIILVDGIPEKSLVFVYETDDSEEWRKASYGDSIGWIKADDATAVFIGEEDNTIRKGSICYVNANPSDPSVVIDLRDEPDESGNSISQLSYGTEIIAEEIENGWVKGTVDGKTGWLEITQLRSYVVDGYYYAMTNSGLSVRTEPTINGSKVTSLLRGETVKAEEFQNGWVKFTKDSYTGWVAVKYMVPCEDEHGGDQYQTEAYVAPSSGGGYSDYSYSAPSYSDYYYEPSYSDGGGGYTGGGTDSGVGDTVVIADW